MWIKTLFLMTAAMTDLSPSQQVSPLIGTWTEINGPGAARIEPCPRQKGKLCAIGLAPSRDGKPGRVDDGIVLSNVEAIGANRWRGSYHDGRRTLPATLRLVSPRVVEMRVCIFVLCQTARYSRNR